MEKLATVLDNAGLSEECDELKTIDGQRRYYKWIFENFELGSSREFTDH